MSEIVLEGRKLRREFAGFVAVDDVDLRVREGTLHALIGPNGAGKTTVFNLLSKFLWPTSGRIFLRGNNITDLGPAEVARKGVVRSFQISAVFPELTVLENVRMALQRQRGESMDFWRSKRILERYHTRALDLLEAVGLLGFDALPAAELSYGRKRALEIATTLALDPKVLLLDEPLAGMGHEDIVRMKTLICNAARDRTVLMVEHNLKVVAEISDVITVMRRGGVLTEGPYEEVSGNPEVVEAYMGAGHA